MHTVELARIRVPDFGLPKTQPVISPQEYQSRIRAVWQRMHEQNLDVVVVYGDREHSANIAFLTGYDPRFEESLLILRPDKDPILLVGNEGMGYAQLCPIAVERRLYQTFSLMGQARDQSAPLETILRESGIGPGARIGVAGWKYFTPEESPQPEHWLETPAFIVDTLRDIVGDRRLVTNCTAMFMHPDSGLRSTNSADQIALCEWASTYASQSVRDALTNLQPGMTEFDAVRLMRLVGIPLSCHLMLSAGPRAPIGLASPSQRVIQLGDPITTALGFWGGLTARAGYVVHGAAELPAHDRDYVDVVVKPYFAAAVAWWESVSVGAPAAHVFDVVDRGLKAAGLRSALNPGHLIHLDEWVHSPFYQGSPYRLRSGAVLQCDIIPVAPSPHYGSNVEDGLALADAALREELAARHPDAWHRITARRCFMEETLHIKLDPSVLPFSNWPAIITPYVLDSTLALRVASGD